MPITAHPSLLFLLLYVFLVASSQFPGVVAASGVDPSLVRGPPVVWAALFALSLVASILIHELSHVWVAQSKGAKVRRVTLLMLGGVSESDPLPDEPRAELKIAIIGPLVSLALAAILFFIHRATSAPNLALYGYWVGELNLALGIFNLLPAFPSDGGRIFRSILAARYGALEGTRKAVSVSRVFVWTFGILGFLQFNLILLFIAFFLYAAAKSELFMVVGHSVLTDMKVGEILVELPVLPEHAPLVEAAHAFERTKSTVLPVGGGFPGTIDSGRLAEVPKRRWPGLHVGDLKIAVENPPTPADSLVSLLERGFLSVSGGLPVVENGEIRGVVRQRDLFDLIQIKDLARDEPTSRPARRREVRAAY